MRTYTLHLAGGGVINLHGGPLNEEVAEQPKPACETCWYWQYVQGDIGECRRHSPRPDPNPEKDEYGFLIHAIAIWPTIAREDWCGEYERAAQAEK